MWLEEKMEAREEHLYNMVMENMQVVFMTEEEGGEGNLGIIALRDNRSMAFSRKGVVLT